MCLSGRFIWQHDHHQERVMSFLYSCHLVFFVNSRATRKRKKKNVDEGDRRKCSISCWKTFLPAVSLSLKCIDKQNKRWPSVQWKWTITLKKNLMTRFVHRHTRAFRKRRKSLGAFFSQSKTVKRKQTFSQMQKCSLSLCLWGFFFSLLILFRETIQIIEQLLEILFFELIFFPTFWQRFPLDFLHFFD